MLIKLKEKKQGLYLLLFAILIATTLIKLTIFNNVHQHNPQQAIEDDTNRYEEPAEAFLETGSLALEPESINSRTLNAAPLYPTVIAAVYKLFGEKNRYAVIVLQILISTLTAFFVYLIAAKLWSRSTGVIAALLMALEPLQFTYSQVMLSEVLSTSMTTLFIVFFTYMMLGNKKYIYTFALLIGVVLAAATMTRPINYPLIVPVVLGIIVFRFWKPITFQHINLTRMLLLVILPYVLIVGSWQVRNGLLTGSYAFSDNGSTLVLRYLATPLVAKQQGISNEAAYAKIKQELPPYHTFAEKLEVEKQMAYDIMWEHKFDYMALMLRNLPSVLIGPGLNRFAEHLGDESGRYYQPIQGATTNVFSASIGEWTGYQVWYLTVIVYVLGFTLLAYLFALYGVITIKNSKEKTWIIHALMLGFVLLFIIFSTGNSFAYSRLRMPLMPVFILYAGYALHLVLLRYNVLERMGIYLTPESLTKVTHKAPSFR